MEDPDCWVVTDRDANGDYQVSLRMWGRVVRVWLIQEYMLMTTWEVLRDINAEIDRRVEERRAADGRPGK